MAASGTLAELEALSGTRGIEAVYRRLSSGVRAVSDAEVEAA
jgi:hypothetical protein